MFSCFTDPASSEVKFDSQGDGLARYTIMNYRRLPNGVYDYKVVLSNIELLGSTREQIQALTTSAETLNWVAAWSTRVRSCQWVILVTLICVRACLFSLFIVLNYSSEPGFLRKSARGSMDSNWIPATLCGRRIVRRFRRVFARNPATSARSK